MKIMHIQLAGPFTDGMGYQENILTRLHQEMGHEVMILTSRATVQVGHGLILTDAGDFVTGTGIPYTRLPFVSWLPLKIAKKVRFFPDYYQKIETFKPDIIFIHDIMFFWVQPIIRYVKKHPATKIYVDSHTDQINSAKTWFSRNILHKLIIRFLSVKPLDPYVTRYWGTLPARMAFYQNFYHLPAEKIGLLPMGLDDAVTDFSKRDQYRAAIRKKYQIGSSDLLVLTGGKLEHRKKISLLVAAVKKMANRHVHLLIFGTPDKDIEQEFENWKTIPNVICIGWIDYKDIFQYCAAADLAVFPGTHSVLWEQSVGSGVVCIFQKWDGFQHVNVNGNCFLENIQNEDDIVRIIEKLQDNPELFEEMKQKTKQAAQTFQYSKIAVQCIGQLKP